MEGIPPTLAKFYRRVRTLVVILTMASFVFAALLVVHSQNPLKGESGSVLLVPNQTVNAGEVKFKPDTDHDGMSDEDEAANGTNPNDPSDADADTDGDGLSNGDEVASGSNINNADSDGDGTSDGDEARLGYNPNDPGNTPPANTSIVGIQVVPSPLELSINSLFGVQPEQMRVNGLLSTGATVDLTQSPDTTYQSLNQSVAQVDDNGLASGVVVGSTSITVQNGSFTVQVPVTVSNYTPVGIAEINIPGYANSVAVQGTYAFVAAGSTGLQIVDVSNYRVPRIVGRLDTPGNANDVKLVGDLAYVADGAAGLLIVNVSNKTAPLALGSLDTADTAQGVVVVGSLAYVADGLSGLQIINVNNPAAPSLIGAVDTPGTARGVDVSENLAVVADDAPSIGLRVININIPEAPLLIGNLTLTGQAKNVIVREPLAYVATNNGGLRVVSLANPSAPQSVGLALPNPFARDVAIVGRFAFAPYTAPGVPLMTLDSNPASPQNRGVVNFSDIPGGPGIAVAADQQYVYSTRNNGAGAALDNGTSGTTSLLIGRYQPRYDRAGIAPSTSVVTPQNGQTVIQGRSITLSANATDDVEVERVQFFVDDQLIATDRIVPYEASFTVPVNATSLNVRTTATDLNGATSSSTTITVVGTSNPAPVVSLLSPQAGTTLIEGQTIEVLAQASDDGSIQRIVFNAGGVTLPADISAPFRTTYTVPTGVSSFTITATATDNLGLSSTVSETFAVTPPFATTVAGRVVTLANQPVSGANVSVFGEFFAVTDINGAFSVPGVSTSRGPISATASADVESQQLAGSSLAVAPVPGGTTNVGNILLQTVHYESDIGNLITFTGPDFNDRATAIALPFSFNFYGVNYSQVFVGTNGYLTFNAGDTGRFESPTVLNGLPRIAPLYDNWAPDQTANRGVFANTSLPGKVIFTWRNVEASINRNNDEVSEEGNFQVVLFADGRIQFGYDKVESFGGLVGISPGGTPILFPLKHTALQGMNIGTTTAPYEQFLGVGDFPFDLQYAFITYIPNFGGYEIQVQRAPKTTVRGRLFDPNGSPVGGARVSALNRTVVSEVDGSFNLEKVPAAEGPLIIRSVWVAPDGRLFQGQSPATPPLINAITDVGDLTLAARGEAFETDLGQLVPHASGSFPRAELPLQFPFRFYGQSFYGKTVDRVYLYASGYLALNTICAKSGCNDQFGLTTASVNDVIFNFSNTPIIAPFFSTLDPGNTGQVFVKSLPDKWVMTFVNVQQPGRPEANTFQVVLHADGTIRFAYNGVGNKHGHVGLSVGVSWGSAEDSYTVNWSATPVRRMPNALSFFETFPGDFGGLSGNNFDLDQNVMVFFPSNDGSYEVIRQQFTGSAPASKILFDSSPDGDVDLFSVNADGSNRVNLTNKRGGDYDAVLSPDGTRIAFDSYRDDPDGAVEDIYVMKLDGTDQVRLTNNSADDYYPIWSPDGTKILFQSNRNGDYEIFIMNADGSDQRSLTGYAGDSGPVWSPDGTKILVNSDRDGLGGFYVMNADGSGVNHLANTGTFGGNTDAFGAWSPDGNRIAFHSYRNGEGEIFIVNADGSGLFNVSNNPSADFVPRWSPDGTRILFFSFRDGNAELYVINGDGSGLVRLTNTPKHESIGYWSPDGTQVAFTTHEDADSSSLYVVNADGTGLRPLVNDGAMNFVLEWKRIP